MGNTPPALRCAATAVPAPSEHEPDRMLLTLGRVSSRGSTRPVWPEPRRGPAGWPPDPWAKVDGAFCLLTARAVTPEAAFGGDVRCCGCGWPPRRWAGAPDDRSHGPRRYPHGAGRGVRRACQPADDGLPSPRRRPPPSLNRGAGRTLRRGRSSTQGLLKRPEACAGHGHVPWGHPVPGVRALVRLIFVWGRAHPQDALLRRICGSWRRHRDVRRGGDRQDPAGRSTIGARR
jgi:hypothetical protein